MAMPGAAAGWSRLCSENHLPDVAGYIVDWREVAPYLGLTEADEMVIIESTQSVPVRKIAMLRKWKQIHGDNATYKMLCEIFEKMRKADLVSNIKQLSSEKDRSLSKYVEGLRSFYQTPPSTWLSLPTSKQIKLAMTNENGTRHTREPDELIEHRIKGEVEPLMAHKVPVDMNSLFNDGIFDNAHGPLVILVEGAFGSGKSTLAYHYCQKWAQGNLGMFDLVALVYLRHPAVRSAGKELTLHQLLLLASDGEEDIGKILRHVTQLVRDGLKFLLILDGWDEAPACIRELPDPKQSFDNSFLGNLLRSVSPNTTILITSRPDSSVGLHNRPNVKRMEILGFDNERIYEYFREALSTQLSPKILKDDCRKLRNHLANYPAIESSCYIPLNAAILTLLYLQRNCTRLPTTHFEMFNELLLCCIAREVNIRQPDHRKLKTISSLYALPHNLKKKLKHISIIAYEGVMNDKIVFTQDELKAILPSGIWDGMVNFLIRILPASVTPTPAQQDLPVMGVLQRVQWAGTSSKSISYNFIHLSIQEMLAAYRISRMGNDEQVTVFQALLDKPRFAAVLQFYAGFTKLTNQGVRDIITGTVDHYSKTSKIRLVSFLRCFFEAQINDRNLYTKFVSMLNGYLSLNGVSLNPLDCMSVGYFLAFALKNNAKLRVSLSNCSIDDHSFSLIMKQLSRHTEECPEDVLHGMTMLDISNNRIGDSSIAHIAAALRTNTTMKSLNIMMCGISSNGLKSLDNALAVNSSLEELSVCCDNGILAALRTNAVLSKLRISCGNYVIVNIASAFCINNTLKRLVVEKGNLTDKGALKLAAALVENRSLEYLKLNWTSAHPDSTLNRIGECIRSSTLQELVLVPKSATVYRVSMTGRYDKKKTNFYKWLRCVETGGKELIQSQEDNPQLRTLSLIFNYSHTGDCYRTVQHSLKSAATAVNAARRSWCRFFLCRQLPPINITIH